MVIDVPPRRARLSDVAREAGVSVSTASRALNGSHRSVPAANRERVLAAAERIGYTANMAAQATARGHYPAIGLVVGDIRDQFFARVTWGVVREAAERALVVNVLSTQGEDHREEVLIQQLRRQRPQSLLLVRKIDESGRASPELLRELRSFENEGGRVVVIGEPTHHLAAVLPTDFDGCRMLGQQLLDLGYRRFTAVALVPAVRSTRDRLDGFRAALSAAGVALPDRDVLHTEASMAGGVAAARQLVARRSPTELVFCLEDSVALGLMWELERHGIRVPDDVAVAGYGDRDHWRVRSEQPVLTSVRTPLEEMGAMGVSMCVETGIDPGELLPDVVIRASTPPHR